MAVGDLVRSRRFGPVAVVELHRPEVRHALNTELLRALIAALGALAAANDVEAVVITGSGGCFSAGADVAEPIGQGEAVTRMGLFGSLYELVATYPTPTVAAISGWCIGGGAEVAAACDLRVGAPSAAIRFPGAVFGVPAGAARLPALVGLSHAKDLLMTARTVRAEEAYRMGFLNRLVGEEELLAEAAALATAMAANPGAIVQKRALDEALGLSARMQAENRGLRRWQSGATGLMG
jgi:enoyl-CoA hydratase/carnithine racemase